MTARALALLLLFSASLRARDPGVVVQGSVTQVARDGSGSFWGIVFDTGNDVSLLVGEKWEHRVVPGLSDRCRRVSLASLPDGDVACLWQEHGEAEPTWVLTRHHGGQSRVSARFHADLYRPTLHGLEDGRMVLTEDGPDSVVIFPDRRAPRVSTVPQAMFLPPRKQDDGTISKDHVHLTPILDGSGTLWLWSTEWRWQFHWAWRLRGLVKVSEDMLSFELVSMGEEMPAVSACVQWDDKHLAVAVVGRGVLLLESANLALNPMPVPDNEVFKFVETLFHDGQAWHAVTAPPPDQSTYLPAGALAGLIVFMERHDGDMKPECSLWRHTAGTWTLVHDGLGETSARPALRTKAGLFLGSTTTPWFFPAAGGAPRHIASPELFPLRKVELILPAGDEQVLLFGSYQRQRSCLWPSDPPNVPVISRRWEEVPFAHQALQDSRGHIWCHRTDLGFARWDGTSWKNFPAIPRSVADAEVSGFVADNRDRGWMMTWDGGPTAICNFSTGEWQEFSSFRQALAAQLPRRAALRFPDHFAFLDPAFSDDGRIGFFAGTENVWLYEKETWRTWKFYDFADREDKLGGAVFFTADGKFSVPLRGRDSARQWHSAENVWRLRENIAPPERGMGSGLIGISVVQDSDDEENQITSSAADRLGTVWCLRDERELFRTAHGRRVSIFAPDEPNPFRHGLAIVGALVDVEGNVLLDTGSSKKHVFLRLKLPMPEIRARLVENKEDTARIVLAPDEKASLWHTWRVDGEGWHPLRGTREIVFNGLLPGKHIVEVRAFNAELTPSKATAKFEIITAAAAGTQLAASLRDLAGPDLDTREAAARMLKSQGAAAVPKLRAARDSASPHVRWWLDAIIQHIERRSAPAPK
jgi:hypothetical protein